MIFEIRNYYFNPDLFEDYKRWAKDEALPCLTEKLDILGFWVNTGDAPEVNGEPMDKLGSANVTWVIKWDDLAHRNRALPEALSSPEWTDIFSRVPGGLASYLRMEAKFTESLL